ncbi:hypothetical protein FD754_024207 [Muntiacus muntjak]|uniref:PHD-type domain-containing protein n=1 Tax=Muntiacus muntjak TaxID=9888 RepID=A0A5N3UQQ8_MUNMU|nr:hypothetical protein FD754_024207 [Muntiacus muntjak]
MLRAGAWTLGVPHPPPSQSFILRPAALSCQRENPEQTPGAKAEKHSQPRLQRPPGDRGEGPATRTPGEGTLCPETVPRALGPICERHRARRERPRERKRLASNYLNTPLFLTARANEDPCWKNEITHDELCAACKRGANLQPCGTCPGAYHLSCLDPPLKTVPKGVWVCPRCQQKALKKDGGVPWTGMLAIVHSYVTHKTVKEEEKQKLLQRGSELQSEHQQLEERDRRLASAVKQCHSGGQQVERAALRLSRHIVIKQLDIWLCSFSAL